MYWTSILMMAKTYRLYIGIVTALALCKYSMAEWNATEDSANRTVSSCHHHGNRNNCTVDSKDTGQWSGHFSKCPKELKHYCIHGVCRYIKEQKVPSCRCEKGYTGSRCEYLDLAWQIGDQRQIIIACVITGLVFLILLIVFICICSHRRYRLCRRRGRQREEPRNGTEKLNMMDTSGTHGTLMPDSTEPLHSNSV
ncbi:probetacellulin [Polymixia lowei]